MAKKTVTTEDGRAYAARQFNGTSFLGLEHVLHLFLVLVLAGLMSVGVVVGMSVWANNALPLMDVFSAYGFNSSGFSVQWLQTMAAALVVIAPAIVILDSRTRGEWAKRPKFAGRLAYKVPLYAAMGVAGLVALGSLINMAAVVLTSLAMIGTAAGFDYGALYLNDFIPPLIMFAVFASVKWYLFKLAKGVDVGQRFNALLAALAVVLAITLFVTGVAQAHNARQTPPVQCQAISCDPTPMPYPDYFKY